MTLVAETSVSAKNLTTVPKAVRNFLGIGAGDTVEWHVEDGAITVYKRSDSGLPSDSPEQ